VRMADNLITFMCRVSSKSGNLNLLESSGLHRAVTGLLYLFSTSRLQQEWRSSTSAELR